MQKANLFCVFDLHNYQELTAALTNNCSEIHILPVSDFGWPSDAENIELTKNTYIEGDWTIPATIKVPKKKLKAYKSLLLSRGVKKTSRITYYK